jgi:V/A-type H+-transporting ATPase subunit E
MKAEQKGEQAQVASSGVEALIEKLRDEGVAAGQQKAESIVADAQRRAEWITQEAEREAAAIRDKAREECDAMRVAGEDALKLAARDAMLRLRDELLNGFSEEVLRAVGRQMADETFLQRLILSLAGTLRKEAGLDAEQELVIELPAEIVGIDDLRKNPDELREGSLSRFAVSLGGDLLRRGVRFEVSEDKSEGLLIRLREGEMLIDFGEATVASLLLQHLQPRFRALLQGVIK